MKQGINNLLRRVNRVEYKETRASSVLSLRSVSQLMVGMSALLLTACEPYSDTPHRQIQTAQQGAFDATVSESGDYAVISSLYHGVSLWDIKAQGLKYQWSHDQSNQELTFNDGDTTAIMSDSNMIFATAISDNDTHAVLADKHNFSMWDITTGQNVGFWQIKKSKVQIKPQDISNSTWVRGAGADKSEAASEPNLGQIDIIDRDKCINVLEVNNERCMILGTIRAIDVSNNGKHLVVGKSNGMVTHITVESGRRLEFMGHQSTLLDKDGEPVQISNTINSLEISPNGRYVLTGSSDNNAYLWDTQTGQVIYHFRHSSRVTKVALDPKGRYAFTADSKKQSRIWDLKTGKALSNLDYINRQEIFSSVRFSKNGKWLVTGAPTRELTIWDVKTGKQLEQWTVTARKGSRPASAIVYSASFINNDSQVLSTSSAGFSEIWVIDHE